MLISAWYRISEDVGVYDSNTVIESLPESWIRPGSAPVIDLVLFLTFEFRVQKWYKDDDVFSRFWEVTSHRIL